MPSLQHHRLAIAAIWTLAIGLTASPMRVEASEAWPLDPLAAIQQVWPAAFLPKVIRIAKLESGLSTTACGRGGSCYGLFQILFSANRYLLASIGISSPSQLHDPVVNSKAS